MLASALEIDYLVIGADATVLMVDRRHRTGGHWNNAYPFVRLHQPSEWYGVASHELSNGTRDAIGFNTGTYGLASGAQVLERFQSLNWNPHVAA